MLLRRLLRSTNDTETPRWLDRGAVLVEAAIAIPILMLLILGSIEAGVAWNAKAGTTNALRSGLLRAASIGDKPETDVRILQSVIGEIGAEHVDRIEWVIIFNASSNGGNHAQTVADCAAAIGGRGLGAGGGDPQCVVYPNADLVTLAGLSDATQFQADHFDDGGNGNGTTYNCDNGADKFDTNFCAPSRSVGGDIEVGVALSYKHEWFTGIFPNDAPTMREIGVSSTFLAEGADITTSNAASTGHQTAYNSGSFNSGTLNDPLTPQITWIGADDSDINTPPADSTRNFLGRFGMGEVISLTVADLGAHNYLCVKFDLYVIGSWDGSGSYGPDMFRVDIDRDGTLEHNVNYTGGGDPNASETDTLGYNTTTSYSDYVVPVEICTDHVDDTVGIDFSAVLTNADLDNESWGIDNVEVVTSWK